MRKSLGKTRVCTSVRCSDRAYGLKVVVPCACVAWDEGTDFVEWIRKPRSVYSLRPAGDGNGDCNVHVGKTSNRITIPKKVVDDLGIMDGNSLEWFISCDGKVWDVQVEARK